MKKNDRKTSSAVYEYKIKGLTFIDGTTVHTKGLTVIIGPNNSGKSRALREIESELCSEELTQKIIKKCEWEAPDNFNELENYPIQLATRGAISELNVLDPNLCSEERISQFLLAKLHEHPKKADWAKVIGPQLVVSLKTQDRLNLVKKWSRVGYTEGMSLPLSLYNAGRSTEDVIRRQVQEAFNKDIALDFSEPGVMQIRVGDSLDQLPVDPRDASSVLSKCERLDEQGDGIRSFVGLLIAMETIKRPVWLIDEPETFLHPPQAFRAGYLIGSQLKTDKQCIVATHSAEILRGIISATTDVQVVRLDRTANETKVHLLDAARVLEVMGDPLLSSARVLDGLFYSCAIVVESEGDERLYSAAFRKYLPKLDVHAVTAGGKHSVPRIIRLYRQFGVRACGIVDIDALDDAKSFSDMLDQLQCTEKTNLLAKQKKIVEAVSQLPIDRHANDLLEILKAATTDLQKKISSGHDELSHQVQAIAPRLRRALDLTKKWKDIKQNGVATLPLDVVEEFNFIEAACQKNGLLINRHGELESLLVDCGLPYNTDKKLWISNALKLLSSLNAEEERNIKRFILKVSDSFSFHQAIRSTALSKCKIDPPEKSEENMLIQTKKSWLQRLFSSRAG